MATEQNQQKQQPQKTEPSSMTTPKPQERTPGRGMEPRRAAGELARPGAATPFSFMERLMGDMGRLFESFSLGRTPLSQLWSGGETAFAPAAWAPQVDMFQRDGNLVIHADLPGLRQEDVSVNVDNGVLTISGERTHSHEHESGGVYRCERSYGTFQRSLALPEGVAPDSIQASFENGVLEVAMPMPKQEAAKGRSIPIRSSSGETKH